MDCDFGRFEVTEEQSPRWNTSTGGYEYELKLEAYYWKWKNKIFKYRPEVTGGNEAGWSLTAGLSMHLDIFLRNLKAWGFTCGGEDFDYEIDSGVTADMLYVTYSNTNLIDALSMMAEAAGCEWWVEGRYIRFGRREQGETVSIGKGKQAQSITLSKSSGEYFTRILAFGGTSNISPRYRKKLEFTVKNLDSGYLFDFDKAVMPGYFRDGMRKRHELEADLSYTQQTVADNPDSSSSSTIQVDLINNDWFGNDRMVDYAEYDIDLSGLSLEFRATSLPSTFTQLNIQIGAPDSFSLVSTQTVSIGGETVKTFGLGNIRLQRSDYSRVILYIFPERTPSAAPMYATVRIQGKVVIRSVGERVDTTIRFEGSEKDYRIAVNPYYASENENRPYGNTLNRILLLYDTPFEDHDALMEYQQNGTPCTVDGLVRSRVPLGYFDADVDGLTVNGVVQTRLMLPEGTPYVDLYEDMTADEIIEGVVTFDYVYPGKTVTVSRVEQDWTDQTEKDADGNEVPTGVKLPLYTIYTADLTGFSQDCIIGGELTLTFQDGSLAGLTFGISWVKDKSTAEETAFQIVPNEDYGGRLPDAVMKPVAENTFVMAGYDTEYLFSDLTAEAEQRLLEEALKYKEKLKGNVGTLTATMYSGWSAGNTPDGQLHPFECGQRVSITDTELLPAGTVMRVIGYELNLDVPTDKPVYTIGESASYSRLGALEDKINASSSEASHYMGGGTTSSSGGRTVRIIKQADSTPPSDSNVYSALRSDAEIESGVSEAKAYTDTELKAAVESMLLRFLRKDTEDSTPYLLRLLSGVDAGSFASGKSGGHIGADGAAELLSILLRVGLQSVGFSTGALGTGFCLKRDDNGDSYLEVDRMLVRKIATFVQLMIQELKHVGGQIVLTPASMKCSLVVPITGDILHDADGEIITDADGEMLRDSSGDSTVTAYRCYFDSTDGERTVNNEFVVGDQARCQTFNISEGLSENVSNTYYWRLVTAVGDDWIELSATDCDAGSTAPSAGDEIVQLGNRTDATRQTAIILSAYGEDAPYIKMYRGINSYAMDGKEFFTVSRTTVDITADRIRFAATGKDVEEAISGAITSVDVEYALSDSPTESPQTGWSTTAPQWQESKYMWQRTKTKTAKGTVYSDATCIQGAVGPQGVPGKDGEDGKVLYTWIRYADNAQGSGISNDPTGKAFIGFAYNKESATESNNPSDYTWSEIKGEQGVPGETGADGKTLYTWIAYSDNANGTPMYQQPKDTTQYIGIATNKESATESTNPGDYTWSKFKGDKGDQGERGLQGLQGEKGEQGIPGADGADGRTSYFHIKYSAKSNPASSSDMTETPSEYIGTYVDYTEADSTNPSKYTWARFKGIQGDKGDQGIPGTNGADGKTYYLHIAYANSADGSQGFSTTDSANKLYIGQYTDTTQADSTDYKKYSWTKIKGEQGKGVSAIEAQYYLSSSDTTQTGGSWQTTCPEWGRGKYFWTRTKVTWTDNTVTYTDPVLATDINSLNIGMSALAEALVESMTFVNTLSEELEVVKDQVDGAIETWFYTPVPTLTNAPASEWTTTELKNQHLGDLYYSGEGKAYRFQMSGSNYVWQVITDTDITKALANAQKAQDTADGKRRVFVNAPTNASAYDVGDLWVNATYGSYSNELLRCTTAKTAGAAWNISHWAKASKYTDDTKANQAIQDAAEAMVAANDAQNTANEAGERLDSWAADGVISPVEKQGLKDEMARIDADKNEITEQYTKYALGTPTAYNNAHTAYRTVLATLSASTPETIDIPSDFGPKQTAYYTQRTAALNAIATAAKAYVDSIEIGGTNLLMKTNQGTVNWSFSASTQGYMQMTAWGEGVEFKVSSAFSGWGFSYYNLRETLSMLEPNTEYMVSFDVWCDISVQMDIHIQKTNATGVLTTGAIFTTAANQTVHVAVKLTTNDLTEQLSGQVLYFYGFHRNAATYRFKNLKMEKGNKATAWSPAPEDLTPKAEFQILSDRVTSLVEDLDYDPESGITKYESLIEQNAQAIQLRATKTEVTQAIADIDIGAANILLRTKDIGDASEDNINGQLRQRAALTAETYLGLAVCGMAKSGTNISSIAEYNISQFEPGEQFTFSFYVRGSGQKVRAYFYGETGYVQVRRTASSNGLAASSYADGATDFDITDQWQRMWVTYQLRTTGDFTKRKYIALRNAPTTSGGTVYVCGLKLERGNKATQWSPAPEDGTAAVDSLRTETEAQLQVMTGQISSKVSQTTYNQNNQQINTRLSSVEQTADSISSNVSEIGGRLSTVEQKADSISLKVSSMLENLMPDGSFEQGLTFLQEVSCKMQVIDGGAYAAPHGTKVLLFSTQGNANSYAYIGPGQIPVQGGQTYTAVFWARLQSGSAVTETNATGLYFSKNSYDLTMENYIPLKSMPLTTSWKRFAVAGTCGGEGEHWAIFRFGLENKGSRSCLVDSVMIFEGDQTDNLPETFITPSGDRLLSTGIDIYNRRITVTGDSFEIRNNEGENTLTADENGNLKLPMGMILAELAKIGEFVYKNEYMMSQNGIGPDGQETSQYENFPGGFTPNFLLNAITGLIHINKGNINLGNGKIVLNDDGSGKFADGNYSWDTNGVRYAKSPEVRMYVPISSYENGVIDFSKGSFINTTTSFGLRQEWALQTPNVDGFPIYIKGMRLTSNNSPAVITGSFEGPAWIQRGTGTMVIGSRLKLGTLFYNGSEVLLTYSTETKRWTVNGAYCGDPDTDTDAEVYIFD